MEGSGFVPRADNSVNLAFSTGIFKPVASLALGLGTLVQHTRGHKSGIGVDLLV